MEAISMHKTEDTMIFFCRVVKIDWAGGHECGK